MRMGLLLFLMFTVFTATDTLADQGGPTSQPADGIIRRGLPLSKKAPLSVAKVIAEAKKHAGNYVKVTGAVKSVCKKKGCWFVIKLAELVAGEPVGRCRRGQRRPWEMAIRDTQAGSPRQRGAQNKQQQE